MFKKTTFAQRTVKSTSKWMKKHPTASVAVGGGLIATTIGGIASSLTFGLKVRKLQNMVPQPEPQPAPASEAEVIEVTGGEVEESKTETKESK